MDRQMNRSSDKHLSDASDHQLKATVQQLRASQQQLKAANQQLKATEEKLRKSRLRYKAVFDSTINAISVYEAVNDGNGFVFRNFNPSAERIEKIKKEDLLAKSVLDVLPTVREFGLFDVLQRVWKTDKPEHYLETIHKNKRIIGWRENYVFKLPSGEIVVIYQDVTERKRAEQMLTEEHNLLRTLIDTLPDYVYIKDTQGRFVIGNIEAAHRAGVITSDELIGKTDSDFYPQHLASKYYADEQRIIRSGQPLINREEQVINQTTGETIWNLTTKVPWRDSHGNVVGIVGIGRNITGRKRAEEALQTANQQLEAANQQLRATEQQLKAANQQLRADEQQLKAANQQLRATEQQLKAANQQLDAGNQQLRASEEELRKLNHELQDRIKELDCLYGLSRLVEHRDISLEQIFEGVVKLIPPAWEYPEITAARINFDGQQFKTANFRETAWMQSADIKVYGQKAGTIEVRYLKKRPELDEGPFLKEERDLLEDIAERLAETIERKRAEEKLLDDRRQLKSLASQLTLVEERERRQIATELHATIAQSLVVSKLQFDTLRASVPSADIAKTLDEVCSSLDQIIQNTRTLTFDLSSPILYELGFETAVAEWLTEQIQQKHSIATEFEDDGQNKPLDDDVRALLFRDVRELLINIVKHAKARKVKVSIRKAGSEIRVTVEDDGCGFNTREIAAVAAKKGGFGLFSIRERLEQSEGRLEIKSAPGQGTKVTVIAPLKTQAD